MSRPFCGPPCLADRRARQLVDSSRWRAKRRGLDYSLSYHDIRDRVRRGHCEATGIPFLVDATPRGPLAPSIDRIDPDAGYTAENVRVVTWMYHALKGSYTDELALSFCEAVARNMADGTVQRPPEDHI